MVSEPAKFKVILAFESYSVGDVIQPTGVWRDSLIARGYIERLVERPVVLEPEPKRKRKKNDHDVINEQL